MDVDSGDKRGEPERLLTVRERASVARHVAAQLLEIAALRRTAPVPRPRFRRDVPGGPLPEVEAACASVLDWLSGTSPAYPLLDDLLREIDAALRALAPAERPHATRLSMATCVLAAAAIARNRGGEAGVADLPPGPVAEMVAAAVAEGAGFGEAAE